MPRELQMTPTYKTTPLDRSYVALLCQIVIIIN